MDLPLVSRVALLPWSTPLGGGVLLMTVGGIAWLQRGPGMPPDRALLMVGWGASLGALCAWGLLARALRRWAGSQQWSLSVLTLLFWIGAPIAAVAAFQPHSGLDVAGPLVPRLTAWCTLLIWASPSRHVQVLALLLATWLAPAMLGLTGLASGAQTASWPETTAELSALLLASWLLATRRER